MKQKSISGFIRSLLEIHRPPYELQKELERLLTFKNPAYQAALRYSPWGVPKNIPEYFCLVYETDRGIRIPRGFNPVHLTIRSRQIWDQIEWKDQRSTAEVKFPETSIVLNHEQRVLFRDFKTAVNAQKRPFGNFLYVAPTSAGKTILQAFIARQTGQRTLVLCLTDQIKRAWYQDLMKMFGFHKKDIGLIQQKDWRIGEHFTLASIQTLARRKTRWKELCSQIGCCIIDECQIIRSPSVFSFIEECSTKYLIGSTATPKEENFRLYALLGTPRKRLFSEQLKTKSSLPLSFVRTIDTRFRYSGERSLINWHHLAEKLALNEKRNQLIARECKKDWDAGESLLIVTKRVPHVFLLASILEEAGIEDVNAITGETNTDRNYTHHLVNAVLNRDVRCVVATIPAVMLGANLNPISRLHLTMPTNSDGLEQLIGRVRRRATSKKNCGLVYYLDRKTPYLFGYYIRNATPVFRKLKVKGFKNAFFA